MMTFVDWLALAFILGLPVIFLILMIIQHTLGYYLSKVYDPILFKQPYFSLREITVYRSWPLSLIKAATYILFTAYPWALQEKRFKGHASPYIPSVAMKMGCRLWVIFLLSGIVAMPVLLVLMFVLPR